MGRRCWHGRCKALPPASTHGVPDEHKTRMNTRKLGLLIVLVGLVAAYFAFDLGQYLSLAYAKGAQGRLAALYAEQPALVLGVYAAVYVAVAALSLPGAAILTLLGGAIFGLLAGTVVVSFASSIGATLAMLVARYVLRDSVQQRFGARLADVDRGIARDGAFYLFTLRLVPLFPFFVVNLLMGLTAIKVRTYYVASQLGMLAGTVVYVNAGTQLARVESLSGLLSPGLIASFVLLGVFPLLARRAADVPLFVADRDVLAEVVGFDLHRGVLASAERRPPPPADEVLGSCSRVVVTEGLNDHENLGALFRNAAALDIDAVLLDDRTADPLYRRCIRVSSGWAAVLPHARLGALPGGYDRLRSHGFRVVALTPSPDALAADRAAAAGWLDDRVAFVVGAEGPGLAPASIAGADAAVRIPMSPGVDSLNVATSLAVVAAVAAARRQWR